ncbi:hypothetical protein D3P07_09630 [Paenibacillus sp. 1011MAR3C5]|uniref:polymorphic toxin type 44 domain-containing protein n=1 Tax=Paenibacillus sp. 1011MAR3C5 TaxID=1675787 RepID=UPI000E6BC8F6|nr:polymorphic toxin type 44 domain-containing protein [Paenibacillus sp. 1011MAR3C5]RJE90440.1 hypothetical protein D3P07_09630 [Paenibacillus sp. 1011MAR3C5]
MKRIVLILLVISLMLSISPVTSASNLIEEVDLVKEAAIISDLTDEHKHENELLKRIHTEVVNRNGLSLNENGQMEINVTAEDVSLDKEIFDKYLLKIERSNYLVSVGGVYFDNNFELVFLPLEEAVNDIYTKDMEKQKLNNILNEDVQRESSLREEIFAKNLIPLNIPPDLFAYQIVKANKQEIQDYYLVALYIEGNRPQALLATTALWISRITNQGIWDYKVQPGYTPHDKKWMAYTRSSQYPSTRTSEWFGNYNYGFTGRFLFSLSILYAGGDGAGIMWGNGFDSVEDKAAIKMGYDESY